MIKNTVHPEKWVDKYSDYLFNYAIVRVSDRENAKDLISETFYSALKSKDSFKGNSSERTWLISILKNKIIDYYRKINSSKGKAEISMDLKSKEGKWLEERVADSNELSAQKMLENVELYDRVQQCLKKLDEKQVAIFRMKILEKIDTNSICKKFGVTPANVWVIVHRTRAYLAKCLDE